MGRPTLAQTTISRNEPTTPTILNSLTVVGMYFQIYLSRPMCEINFQNHRQIFTHFLLSHPSKYIWQPHNTALDKAFFFFQPKLTVIFLISPQKHMLLALYSLEAPHSNEYHNTCFCRERGEKLCCGYSLEVPSLRKHAYSTILKILPPNKNSAEGVIAPAGAKVT